jgi:hypothetical protein
MPSVRITEEEASTLRLTQILSGHRVESLAGFVKFSLHATRLAVSI